MSDPRDFPYQCPTCGTSKRFLTLVGLWSHLENKHPKHGHSFDSLDSGNSPPVREQNGPVETPLSSTIRQVHEDKKLQQYNREARELERQLQEAKAREKNNKYLSLPHSQSVFSPNDRTFETNSLKDVPVRSQNHLTQRSRSEDLLTQTHNNDVFAQVFNDDVFTPPASPKTEYRRVNLGSNPDSYPGNYSTLRAKPVYDEVIELVERLKGELHVKELRLHRANNELETLAMERRKMQHEIIDLSKDKDPNQEQLENLRQSLEETDNVIREKEKEVINLTQFLRNTADKEAHARGQLEDFINGLINRAEKAESELNTLRSPHQSPYATLPVQPTVMNNHVDYRPHAQTMKHPHRPVEPTITAESHHPVENSRFTKNLSPNHHHSMDDLNSDYIYRDEVQPASYAGKHPFSCSDSGIGSSIPSSKTANDRKNHAQKLVPVGRDTATLQKKEKELREELRKIQDLLKKPRRRKRKKSSSSMLSEPSADYSSDSMTYVTDDTEPDSDLEESLRKLQQAMEGKADSGPNRQDPKRKGPRAKGEQKWPSQSYPVYTQTELDKRRRDVLFGVFMYLDTANLCKMAGVCREWRDISRHPALWRNIRLGKSRISAKFLSTISKWATQVRCLTLMGLKPRQKKSNESMDDYVRLTRGSLESGIERLFRINSETLVTLKLVDCRNLITDKTLWLASCYCRKLKQVVYISETDPACAEVLWSLGRGCREIKDLIVPPIHPNEMPHVFNDACCETIGRSWPHLNILCIGGTAVTENGLIAIASHCARLQILELDHMGEMTENIARAMCRAGLRGLEVIDFTFTRVTPEALIQFNSSCSRLKSISVHIGISDYFQEKDRPEHRQYYDQIANQLKSLRDRPAFHGILTVQTDYG